MTPPFTQTHDRLRRLAKVHKIHVTEGMRLGLELIKLAAVLAFALWFGSREYWQGRYADIGRNYCATPITEIAISSAGSLHNCSHAGKGCWGREQTEEERRACIQRSCAYNGLSAQLEAETLTMLRDGCPRR